MRIDWSETLRFPEAEKKLSVGCSVPDTTHHVEMRRTRRMRMRSRRVARYTREEAEQKVGRKVHSLVEFSGVPFGTHGTVVGVEEVDSGWYDVVIEWEPP